MAAGAALITLEAAAVDEPILMAIAAGTAEPIGPARLLQSSLTLLLGAVESLKLWLGEAFLELDRTAHYDLTCTQIPVRSRPGLRRARSALGTAYSFTLK